IRASAMEPSLPREASHAQPVATSPLKAYQWHSGRGEKGPGGFRWGRFASWGRALSHQEPMVSSQPAPPPPRSLFRRVLSAPPKESRPSGLRLSKTLWARQKTEPLEPKAPEPEPGSPAPQIPEAPTPDAPVWDIGSFALLDGRLVLLGSEEEGPRRSRVGSTSSEGSMQTAIGNVKDGNRGRTEPEAASSSQVHNVRGLLKRLKEKKKAKLEMGAHTPRDGSPSALGSRESLATFSGLDLGAERDVRIWPLHSSLLGEPYCFQVTWAGGSHCFSCRSGAERDRWIEDLRRQFQPCQDSVEREETWLSVWVHEAKGLPRTASTAPGVRTELWLDGALLARTAARSGPGQLFWAERFHFEALPAARRLSLRLRGADPEGPVVGRVTLALEEVSVPHAPPAGLERWFPLLGAQARGALRARIRARRLRVLPSERYKELAEFLTFHYTRLCGALEPALPAMAKEELATAMVRVLRATGRAQVRRDTSPGGGRLEWGTEGRVPEPLHAARLASDWFPAELGTVFSGWREVCKARGSEALGPRLVCASLFLRFLCPAILAPSLFGLAPDHPAPGPARTLTLIAKVIQNLANRAPFGEKEAYMGFMNAFLEEHGPAMQGFLDQVAVVDTAALPSSYQGSGDLALQLAVLHAQLCTIFAELDQTTRDGLEPLPTILQAIEEGRPAPVCVPMHLPRTPIQVHSSFSAGERPGFLAPRDLPKHTPLISKSQSLRSFQGAGSWARRRPDEQKRPRPLRPVQRTQSVPVRRCPSVGGRQRPKGSQRPAPRGRALIGESASLPRRPSVPWQRQLDLPRDREQMLDTRRPMGKLSELQCEVAALRKEQRALSRLVESLNTHVQALGGQPGQLRRILILSIKGARVGEQPSEGCKPISTIPPTPQENRLSELERAQGQLREAIQSLQLLTRTPGSGSQPLALKAPLANGDTT
uniref:RAS protein activator like 3 n=1 Tax=Jaculus jaculus TaxID=51337 RepID=A0A8C5KM41_JACJA